MQAALVRDLHLSPVSGHVDVPSSSDATLIYFWPASRAAATACCTVIDLRALSRRMSMGRFMPAITSISPAFSSEMARFEGVPPNRSVSRITPDPRSEEHTSELQSLMRNKYAAFCLKKKNNKD